MKNKVLLTFLTLLVGSMHLLAQVSTTPVFASADDTITLTYDASLGSRGLNNFTGAVYGHFGAILQAGGTGWQNVVGNWGTDDPRVRMTSIGNNKYTIRFHVRSFFNVPANQPIFRIGCVFRSVDGSREGKTAENSDIFYDLVQPGAPLQTRLLAPTSTNLLVTNGSSIAVRGAASANATLTLTDNGVQVATASNSKELNTNVAVNTNGLHRVVFRATSGNQSDSSVFNYFVAAATEVANPPAGLELGANMNAAQDSITLLFAAPGKQAVFVLGNFNDYKLSNDYLMKRSTDGNYFWAKFKVTPGQTYTYQYFVDGAIRVADPLSTLILDPDNDSRIPSVTYPNLPAYPTGLTSGHVSVLQPGKAAYQWKVNNFQRPQKGDLVIYELLVRDFVARHDYQTLIDSINYLKRMGITAVQLMPVNEFENNESWGYNPSYHMAVDKYYGTPDKLKEFIDVCHQNGMAVIADVVFNHAFDQSPLVRLWFENGKPAANSPYLNPDAKHPFNVGYDFNHESAFTKAYVERCIRYWLTEYRFDGFRFDLSKGFTQRFNTDVGAWGAYDQSRIDILKRYHQVIQQTAPGAYTILEHFANNDEETALANEGMMLWGNMTWNYNQTTMGYADRSQLGGVSPRSRGWTTATNANGLIGYMESHDEERLMFKNISFGNSSGGYSTRDVTTALRRVEAASAFFYTVPGPKMLWQFGELGYDFSIDFNGRVGNKPIRWDYFDNAFRRRLYNATSNMMFLKTNYPVFRSLNYNDQDLNQGLLKHFHVSDASMNVTVIGNFEVTAQDVIPYFQTTGKWYNYMTGDSITVANVQAPIRMLPGEYRIYTSVRLPRPPAGYLNFTVATQDFNELVNEFTVYPNPSVSSRIYVGYNLRQSSQVQWDVFNLQGQRVTGSAQQARPAGSHQDEILTNLPSGTYFVRLNVDGRTATQKITVME